MYSFDDTNTGNYNFVKTSRTKHFYKKAAGNYDNYTKFKDNDEEREKDEEFRKYQEKFREQCEMDEENRKYQKYQKKFRDEENKKYQHENTSILEKYKITTKKEWYNWLRKNHPDKGDSDEEICKAVITEGKNKGW